MLCAFLLCTVVVCAQKFVVFSVTGNPQLVTSNGNKVLKAWDTVTPDNTLNIPYDASVRLVDQANKKQYILKTPGSNKVSSLIAQKGNSAIELSQRYLEYIAAQVSGSAKLTAAKHSDVATVTREKQTYQKEDEDEEDLDPMEKEYRDFVRDVTEEYENFRAEVNKEYAEFMKLSWKNFGSEPPIPQPKQEEVKPLVLPKKERGRAIKSRPIKLDNVMVPVMPSPQPMPIEPIEPTDPEDPSMEGGLIIPRQNEESAQIDPVTLQPIKDGGIKKDIVKVDPLKIQRPAFEGVEFNFYGARLKVHFSANQRFTLSSLSTNAISEAWEKLSAKAYNSTIIDCLNYRTLLNLSDWAYVQLLQRMTEAALGKGNEATLLTAYIFCQSGYQMRIGRTPSDVVLLYACRHLIYNHAYYTLDGEMFYPMANIEGEISICNLPYPAEQALSLILPAEQEFAKDATQRRDLVSTTNTSVRAGVSVNKNLIDFYSSYPTSEIGGNVMTRWAMYANTPLADDVKEQLYPQLRQKIEGKSELDAVNILLDFVQTSLQYEYDEVVWGQDRVFFAEETLFYPYADCEDRSILFTRLVRDLVGLKAVLVYYPGHLASAVHFTKPVDGDYLTVDGERFTIADATYIGAPVGCTMPTMDNLSAQAIVLQ